MENKRRKAFTLLLLSVIAMLAISTIGSEALTANAWLVGQTFLDAEFRLGIAGNIAFGSCGIYWSAVAGLVCPWAGVAIGL
ncbi:hypothetical protein GF406_00885 [candidate division KSB1 bacterium]|nr:hypothetical protein [candidate division KSB1 bacterium]